MKQNVFKKRGGLTLIEVILAIVVVAVIMGIVIPKVMSNSDKAQIKQVISSDVRSIIQAAADWKRTSADAGGTYTNIAASKLDSRLPSNMSKNSSDQITSSGFNGGCVYGLVSSTITNAGDSFELAMDCTNAKNALNWSAKLQAYATEAFKDTVKSLGGKDVADDTSSSDVNGIDCSSTTNVVSCITKISQ
jgi:prepilin-type N-terminal cleavage/methylation domain-containing protein